MKICIVCKKNPVDEHLDTLCFDCAVKVMSGEFDP